MGCCNYKKTEQTKKNTNKKKKNDNKNQPSMAG